MSDGDTSRGKSLYADPSTRRRRVQKLRGCCPSPTRNDGIINRFARCVERVRAADVVLSVVIERRIGQTLDRVALIPAVADPEELGNRPRPIEMLKIRGYVA